MGDPVTPVRVLILSDLHAFEGEAADSAPSRLAYSGTGEVAKKLFDGVSAALKTEGVEGVDYLICPGDITNRAGSGALARAWDDLNELAKRLGATLVASAGNHDYASRKPEEESKPAEIPEIDPKDALLELVPPFPSGSDSARQCYFAYSYAIVDSGPLLVVTLNSSTYHGLSHVGVPEHDHGRVTPHTIGRLEKALDEFKDDPRPRLLVTHHHPIQLPGVDLNERSQIEDSTLLLSALESSGHWLIVHGHKHRPWIQYSYGGGDSPTVVSAGSFSANLGGGDFGSGLQNQFYLIELLGPEQHNLADLNLAGVVRAWTRASLSEPVWYPAQPNQGLSARSGFGWRISPTALAPRMLEWIKTQDGAVDQDALRTWEPRIDYLLPSDRERLFALVERAGNLKLQLSEVGLVTGVKFLGGGSS